ncbi:glutathione peroxidase [Chitinivorax tropicus]|uniref:Glutathione peroxidase n=1 Tax=Chitinivorax tropicus TaxID=714531 RepID=A0A840MPG1_9PROT|nr:glutathione peroxidase [Chitinivorax tropicus]MBB5019345.1 glutathione peroxidase [Chitinivorax tropicus]
MLTRALLPAVFLAWSALSWAECPPLLNHQFRTLQKKPIDLCQWQGKPILVVNTASKCGFTPQFEKLESLYKQYRDKGLLVIGFPSNDFWQEPKDNEEIADFCKLTYFVEFPMVEKSAVTGDDANPFYKQLKAISGNSPRWNFHKYLIAPDGKTVYSWGSSTKPDDQKVMEKLLPMLGS